MEEEEPIEFKPVGNYKMGENEQLGEPLLGKSKSRAERAQSIMDLTKKLSRKFTMREASASEGEADGPEPAYCPICYTNEIIEAPNPIGEEKMTWEFSCGHRFCVECTREDLRIKIKKNDVDKLICLQNECGAKVTMQELNRLFENEPEAL